MTPTDLSQQARERADVATLMKRLGGGTPEEKARDVVSVLRWLTANGELADYDDELANRVIDARIIVEAFPALCDAIDAQAKEIERLRGALEKLNKRVFSAKRETERSIEDGDDSSYNAGVMHLCEELLEEISADIRALTGGQDGET